jgi:hypothetical protein
MTMKALVLGAALLGFAGCGKKSDDPAKQLMSDYAAIKDKLCACTDKDCTTKLKADADALEASAKEKVPHPTADQKKDFHALESQVNDCARRF